MNKTLVVAIVCVVLAGGGGFFGGVKYQQSKRPTFSRANGTVAGANVANFGARRNGGAAGGGFVNGEVMSVSGSNMTVKLMNGGSQIVVLAPSTQYRKAVDGSETDVTTGTNVTITGTTNSDGSLTAQSVQIRQASSTPATIPQQ